MTNPLTLRKTIHSVPAPFDPVALANSVLDECRVLGVAASPMKLQKLMWLLHGFRWARFGVGAATEPFEAWPYGPVCPDVYYVTTPYGANPVEAVVRLFGGAPRISEGAGNTAQDISDVRQLIANVVNSYGGLTAGQLSELSHLPGSPWHQTKTQFEQRTGREIRPSDHQAIPDVSVRDYFTTWLRNGTPPGL